MAKKTTTAVARPGTAGLPAHLAAYKSTGAGIPKAQDDFLIPMAKVLDAKSPEVQKKGINYVPGAEAGDILIKGAPVPLIKGDVGFLFQPCHGDKGVIEWVPRSKGGGGGTGFVARHPADFLTKNPKDVRQIEREGKKIWQRVSTKNDLIETRYYGGYMIDEAGKMPPMPLQLAFSSTGHTVAKRWNMLMASKRVGDAPADMWLVYYRFKTRLQQRGEQSWSLYDISDAAEKNGLPDTYWAPTKEDAERGRSLFEALQSGSRQYAATEPQSEDM